MTAGSLVATLLVIAWSRVENLVAFYAVWLGIGLAMAAVLYEAAFTVLAKHFAEPEDRRRAMTAMTLVAALASFIFVPLAQALIARATVIADRYGQEAYWTIAGIAASIPIAARALAPVAAALYAAAVGYSALLWTLAMLSLAAAALAYRAELDRHRYRSSSLLPSPVPAASMATSKTRALPPTHHRARPSAFSKLRLR